MPKADELAGNVYGKLTVIEKAGKNRLGRTLWRCRCSCGKEKVSQGYWLKNGKLICCDDCKVDSRIRKVIKQPRKMAYKPTKAEKDRIVKLVMLYRMALEHTKHIGCRQFKTICKCVDEFNIHVTNY